MQQQQGTGLHSPASGRGRQPQAPLQPVPCQPCRGPVCSCISDPRPPILGHGAPALTASYGPYFWVPTLVGQPQPPHLTLAPVLSLTHLSHSSMPDKTLSSLLSPPEANPTKALTLK